MENIKEIVKNNLIKLRKDNKFTQLELAQKVGYSDKAISRWETGETTPDVETLNVLAELYKVPMSYFFEEVHENIALPEQKKEIKKVNKLAISLLCIVSVWFVAIIVFDILRKAEVSGAWLSFIWAIPASFLLAVVFNAIWGKRIWTFIFASILSWTFILSVYLQFKDFASFMIFIAGVPVQAVIILAFYLNKKKESKKALSK